MTATSKRDDDDIHTTLGWTAPSKSYHIALLFYSYTVYINTHIMVLTDRQRTDLHAGIFEYLSNQKGDAFQRAAAALKASRSRSLSKTIFQQHSREKVDRHSSLTEKSIGIRESGSTIVENSCSSNECKWRWWYGWRHEYNQTHAATVAMFSYTTRTFGCCSDCTSTSCLYRCREWK